MTREEIIRMAQDAGALVYGPVNHKRFVKTGRFSGPVVNEVIDVLFTPETLEHFVTLVAAAERDACAQIVERNAAACDSNTALRDILMSNAAAIRARGDA